MVLCAVGLTGVARYAWSPRLEDGNSAQAKKAWTLVVPGQFCAPSHLGLVSATSNFCWSCKSTSSQCVCACALHERHAVLNTLLCTCSDMLRHCFLWKDDWPKQERILAQNSKSSVVPYKTCRTHCNLWASRLRVIVMNVAFNQPRVK